MGAVFCYLEAFKSSIGAQLFHNVDFRVDWLVDDRLLIMSVRVDAHSVLVNDAEFFFYLQIGNQAGAFVILEY